MKQGKIRYYIINSIVLLLAVGLLVFQFFDEGYRFDLISWKNLIVIIVTAILVNIIKFARISLILYGSGMDALNASTTYCKVTFVSVLLPYKLGEFFRMYCYGNQLKNIMKGIVTIVLDRFMDTVALVTMMFIVWVISGGQVTRLMYIFLIFLGIVLVVYIAFPGLHNFWKKYLLKAKATEFGLTILKTLEVLNSIYVEVRNVSRGRGILLFFLSLLAWVFEIGSIALINRQSAGGKLSEAISNYLSSVLGVGTSLDLKRFVLISVIILVAMYGVIEIFAMISRKKEL